MQLNYQEIYEETKADLKDAELIRRKNMPLAILGSLIVLIAPTWLLTKMTLILVNGTNEDIPEWLIITIALLTMIGIAIIRYFAFRSVQLIFRGLVIPKIVEKIGHNFSYSQMGEVDGSFGDKSKFFPTYALWNGKDHVKGKVDGKVIELSKIVLKTSSSSSSSESSSSQSTTFTGVMIHMEVETNFTDPVWIIPRKRLFGSNFPMLSDLPHREKIRIDGLLKGYELHTTNSILAKRLFSGHRLTQLNDLITNFRKKGIARKHLRFAFFDNHICITFERKKGVFSLSWMPMFTNINSSKFIEKQLLVLNAALSLNEGFIDN